MKNPIKLILVSLSLLGLIGYIAFNIWLFRSSIFGSNTVNTVQSIIPSRESPTPTQNIPALLTPLSSKPSLPTAPNTPIPTAAPLQGPGRYACDPLGLCNDYSDEMRKFCTTTFADRHCLNQCGDQTKWCKQ